MESATWNTAPNTVRTPVELGPIGGAVPLFQACFDLNRTALERVGLCAGSVVQLCVGSLEGK